MYQSCVQDAMGISELQQFDCLLCPGTLPVGECGGVYFVVVTCTPRRVVFESNLSVRASATKSNSHNFLFQ